MQRGMHRRNLHQIRYSSDNGNDNNQIVTNNTKQYCTYYCEYKIVNSWNGWGHLTTNNSREVGTGTTTLYGDIIMYTYFWYGDIIMVKR